MVTPNFFQGAQFYKLGWNWNQHEQNYAGVTKIISGQKITKHKFMLTFQ